MRFDDCVAPVASGRARFTRVTVGTHRIRSLSRAHPAQSARRARKFYLLQTHPRNLCPPHPHPRKLAAALLRRVPAAENLRAVNSNSKTRENLNSGGAAKAREK